VTSMKESAEASIDRTVAPWLLRWLLPALVFTVPALADDKPYAPTMKVRTHHVAVDVQPDGTTTTRYEYAYTALAESALKSVAEDDISYHESNGTLENVAAYTLKANGRKIPVPETNVQVTSHNGVNGAPPAFSDMKNRRLIFPDVQVGDTAVLQYTIRDEKPSFKGYFSMLTWFSEATAYDDAQVVITAPRSLGLKYKSYNLDEPEIGAVDAGRQRWKWTYRNATPKDLRKESSLFARAWRYSDWPAIEISNFRDYGEIATAYEGEAKKRAVVTDRIRTLAAEIVTDAGSPRARAEKIYAWVAREISFAGNCLTGGDVVPRDTDLILNMKMGDCKDHATLMQALLAAQGIDSAQVLINTGGDGYSVPEIPCWQAFNHVITYLPAFDVYLDATSSSSPFGVLPDQEYGKPVIRTSDFEGVQRVPGRAVETEWSEATSSTTILTDGSIEATAGYRLGGTQANVFSHTFTQWQKSPNFDNGSDQIRRVIEAQGYKGSGGYDVLGPMPIAADAFAFGLHYRVDAFLDTDNPYGLTLTPFFPSPNAIASLAVYAASEPYPHDFLCQGDRKTETLSITFPANVKLLAIPKDVHARTELLQFDSHYQRVDNTIRVTRTVVDKSPGPVCPGDVSRQYSQIGAAIKKDARAQAVYEPR
jgi:Domain of Unknown Function with PDB structure (DUF3857)/Transglutaminase-like superfamily